MSAKKLPGLVDPAMSLEDFLLMRLEMAAEQFEENHDSMIEMVSGGFIIVLHCLQLVKITSKHAEITEAIRKAIAVLEKRHPKLAAFDKEFGLTVFNKLEAEQKGAPVDWEYCNKLGPDSLFLAEEIKRVYG